MSFSTSVHGVTSVATTYGKSDVDGVTFYWVTMALAGDRGDSASSLTLYPTEGSPLWCEAEDALDPDASPISSKILAAARAREEVLAARRKARRMREAEPLRCNCGWSGPRESSVTSYHGTERHEICPECGRDLVTPYDYS